MASGDVSLPRGFLFQMSIEFLFEPVVNGYLEI